MRALNRAAADVQRRRKPAIHAKRCASGRRAHNIDNRVDGADLMKVHTLNRNLMNRSLSFAQQFKRAAGAGFYVLGHRRRANDL